MNLISGHGIFVKSSKYCLSQSPVLFIVYTQYFKPRYFQKKRDLLHCGFFCFCNIIDSALVAYKHCGILQNPVLSMACCTFDTSIFLLLCLLQGHPNITFVHLYQFLTKPHPPLCFNADITEDWPAMVKNGTK